MRPRWIRIEFVDPIPSEQNHSFASSILEHMKLILVIWSVAVQGEPYIHTPQWNSSILTNVVSNNSSSSNSRSSNSNNNNNENSYMMHCYVKSFRSVQMVCRQIWELITNLVTEKEEKCDAETFDPNEIDSIAGGLWNRTKL